MRSWIIDHLDQKKINKHMKKSLLLLSVATLLLTGCNSNSKEEKYNNFTPDKIYRQGVKNLRKHRYAQAVEDFQALESRYPFGEYADKSQLGAIYGYYENEDYASALPAVDRFIRMYPRHPNVDYAYYLKGLIHYTEAVTVFSKYLPLQREERDTTPLKKGLAAFNTLITNYPQSMYAPDAKLRMVHMRNLLATSELVAARFYMQKKAYLAAANRCAYVIANFDQTPTMPEALAIQVQAYRKLKLNDLANDSYRVLKLNYPQSSYIKELG
jgi:outer membrane protein assembly factor BamD